MLQVEARNTSTGGETAGGAARAERVWTLCGLTLTGAQRWGLAGVKVASCRDSLSVMEVARGRSQGNRSERGDLAEQKKRCAGNHAVTRTWDAGMTEQTEVVVALVWTGRQRNINHLGTV